MRYEIRDTSEVLLETPRLILRDFTADDWLAVFAYQRDPRYLRLYEWADRTPDEVRAFVQMFIDQQSQQPRTRFQLAVSLRQISKASSHARASNWLSPCARRAN